MLRHNHHDLMAFTTPSECCLRHGQDNRNASHGHKDVAVTKERTPKPGHAVDLQVMLREGNPEPRRLKTRRSEIGNWQPALYLHCEPATIYP